LANDNAEDAGEKRRAILLRMCGSKVYKLMSDLLGPVKLAAKGYDDLTKLIKYHFAPKPSEIVQRYKFHNRFPQQGETLAQYDFKKEYDLSVSMETMAKKLIDLQNSKHS